jgi:hypothetical protein
MPHFFKCNFCGFEIAPDGAGLVAWAPGAPAVFAHTVCRPPEFSSRALLERARREPVGLLVDVLLPAGVDALPASVQHLAKALLLQEAEIGRGH